VGHELVGAFGCAGEVLGLGRAAVDLEGGAADGSSRSRSTGFAALAARLDDWRPDLVVNAASYNEVDRAEGEPELAHRINAEAVGQLGQLCRERRIGLVHYSTDFVFDGKKLPGNLYTEEDPARPLGAYGRSKLAGEQALRDAEAPAVVFRTAWVYSLRRKSFVSAILRGARQRESLSVVADQVGNPTFCRDLAVATALAVRGLGRDVHGALLERRGVYHLANQGHCSRHELAVAALAEDPRRHEHRATRVDPVPTSAYPLPAARPAYAPLDCTRASAVFGVALPPWRDGLRRALADAAFQWEQGAPSAPPTPERKKDE
jgi:dTDP-4-dehydrorhamnose reductase